MKNKQDKMREGNTVPKLRNHFNVYSDGSYRRGNMGAGWVIYQDENKVASWACPVAKPAVGSSTLAELNAARLALASIPLSAHVTLHMDCAYVIEKLEQRHENPDVGGQDKYRAAAEKALRGLFAEAARHQSLTVVKANDRVDKRMREAHDLASEGADLAQQFKNRGRSGPSKPGRF